MTTKGRSVTIRRGAATEGSAGNGKFVMFDRVKYTQAGIRAVARQENHLDSRLAAQTFVNSQQLFNHGKSITGFQNVVFMFYLIARVSIKPFVNKHLVTVIKVEQCTR